MDSLSDTAASGSAQWLPEQAGAGTQAQGLAVSLGCCVLT